MPYQNITDVDTFTATLQALADGDAANGTNLLAVAQGFANRTRNLKNRLDGVEAYVAGDTAAHRVSVPWHLGLPIDGTWTRDYTGLDQGWVCSTNSSEIEFPIDHLLREGTVISEIRARVDPGGTTAVSPNTMQLLLRRRAVQKSDLGSSVNDTPIAAEEAADSSGAAQLLTAAGPTTVTFGNGTYHFTYSVVVTASNTAGSASDRVQGIDIEIAHPAYAAP